MNTTRYVTSPNAKHTYRIDLKLTRIQTVMVEANSLAEAKAQAQQDAEKYHRQSYDWITFGHCTKEHP